MTIWEPISVYRALRWDAAISAETYLRIGASLAIFMLLIGFASLILGYAVASLSAGGLGEILSQGVVEFGLTNPIVILAIIPLLALILFALLFSLKAAVMRLHAFNLSGWWLLAIVGMNIGLSYFGAFILAAVFSSFISFSAYFYSKDMATRWSIHQVFQQTPQKFEALAIAMFAVFTWFSILGDPLFVLIDMM